MKNPSPEPRRVEQLERFGKSLSDYPKEAFEGQGRVMLRALRRKFGLLGIFPFAYRLLRERRRLLKRYPTQYQELCARTGKLA